MAIRHHRPRLTVRTRPKVGGRTCSRAAARRTSAHPCRGLCCRFRGRIRDLEKSVSNLDQTNANVVSTSLSWLRAGSISAKAASSLWCRRRRSPQAGLQHWSVRVDGGEVPRTSREETCPELNASVLGFDRPAKNAQPWTSPEFGFS